MAKTHRIRKLSRASRLFGARFRARYPLRPGIMREGFSPRGYAAGKTSEFDGFSPSGEPSTARITRCATLPRAMRRTGRLARVFHMKHPFVLGGVAPRAVYGSHQRAARWLVCCWGLGRIPIRLATRNFQPLSTLCSFRPCVLAPRGSEGGGGLRSAVYCQPVSALVKARA